MMHGKADADWAELVAGWKAEQEELSRRIEFTPLRPVPRYVGGADIAFSADRKTALAVALVWDRERGEIVEMVRAARAVEVPYIPGFLSFREGPVLEEAIGKLKHPFGVMCFDGQGYAHPRRCGLASYVGVRMGLASIGVAKSRLVGEHKEPGLRAGSMAKLMDRGEQIGVALRTIRGVRPIYVSVGNRVDLASAVEIVMACVTRYRVPEPTRRADMEVGKVKREGR
jgi:deoxyribonuclease V